MTVHKKAIIEILGSIRKLTTSKALVMSIFESSGIIIDDRLLLVSLTGNAEACLSSLMDKLSLMPSIKISAERIFRRLGLTTVMTERLSRQPVPIPRWTSWLIQRMGMTSPLSRLVTGL